MAELGDSMPLVALVGVPSTSHGRAGLEGPEGLSSYV